jgi:CSLREA domain-containing protein
MKRLALVLVLLPLAASAATISVNSTADNTLAGDGACTLREAIANVNAAMDTTGGDCVAGSGSGDTIGFAVAGTIRLALGQLTVWRDVTITGNQTLLLDGAYKTRVFEIAAGTTRMSGLTVQHGRGPSFSVDLDTTVDPFMSQDVFFYAAGGILVDNAATLALTDCTLTNNVAGQTSSDFYASLGAAIYNSGTLSLNRCTLHNNTVGSQERFSDVSEAAGIYNDVTGALTITDCVLTHNVALTGSIGTSAGAAISNYGTMTASGSTISRNQCRVGHQIFSDDSGFSYGGAIENNGVAALDRCVLSNNLAGTGTVNGPNSYGGEGAGGAIDNSYAINSGSLTVSNCTFTANSVRGGVESVGSGGAISSGDTATIVNSTLIGNSVRGGAHAQVYGGAIFGATAVTNCTLTNNVVGSRTLYDTVGAGGGVFAVGTITNSIIAASGVGMNCDDYSVGSGGHNMSDDDSCAGDATDLIKTAPVLAPLRNYGGPTLTRALCTAAQRPHPACTGRSPAIDAGDDSVTGPPLNLTTDQRSLPRLSGAHVDIGAYEVQQ